MQGATALARSTAPMPFWLLWLATRFQSSSSIYTRPGES